MKDRSSACLPSEWCLESDPDFCAGSVALGYLKRFRQRTIAAIYRPLIARHEEFIAPVKQDLFRGISGRVLEIGPGPGGNLKYLGQIEQWVGIEPNPFMHRFIEQQLRDRNLNGEIRLAAAEELPFPDNSFDFAISTLVLCSVTKPAVVVSELRRVLRPGGQFCFIEHVAAPPNSKLRWLQNASAPFYRFCGDGCHPNRETGKTLQQSGFGRLEFQEFRAPATRLPVVVSPHISGFAQVDG